MFREVNPQEDLVQMEERILHFWEENRVFQKSLEQRAGAPRFVFYEGPPTANGQPGMHHVLARAFKDLFPRYKTMKGYYVLRKAGWDTHGLPVELEIEKELGLASKAEIEAYGVAQFNARCRESVFRYVEEWQQMTQRIGFWLDMDHPYITLTNDYIESLWWVVKTLWDRDFIYRDYKVVPYCPRCGTALSSHELALGYDTAVDPSIYVKFPLRDETGTYFLSWTTTPWTLPGNAALAVAPEEEYVLVQQGDERLVLGKALLQEALMGDYRVLRTMRGRELVGKHYMPLYTFLPVEKDYCRVIAADFVSVEEGTGIVHMAPAFGEDDLATGKEEDLPIIHTVDEKGAFIDQVTPWRGLFVKDADPLIIEDLQKRGLMYRVGTYEHIYPFCWRCETPLLYYAKTSWFIETTRLKDELLENNRKIKWYPAHIRDGRFGNWLENNVDWALGRERYWGTPLPIWECASCGAQECMGRVEELSQRAGRNLSGLDLHRPHIDEVTFRCGKCQGTMRRVPEVLDAWFDSGAMPVAQWHYPLENQELFAEQFPADFICEAVDQTRGWFYTLHALSTLLFGQICYRNVICLGLVLDAEGVKMSKSRGNVVDPWEVLNEHGADAVRWYLYSTSPPGNDRRFSSKLVGEVVRKFFLTLWNIYSFFTTYARLDRFQPKATFLPVGERPSLDRWIIAELNRLVDEVDRELSGYNATGAARRIEEFVDVLSNWYVRRSRRRFWKSEQDWDKAAAYLTLYECLVTLAKLMAPLAPFIAEEIYRNLVASWDGSVPESIHLTDFPQADRTLVDEELIADTRLVMRLASLGRSARNRAGIKLRQPLRAARILLREEGERPGVERLAAQLLDELNVKELEFVPDPAELVSYRVRPVAAHLGPRYGPLFPTITQALTQADAREIARKVRQGQGIELNVKGEWVNISPEEIEVGMEPKEGLSLAEEAGYMVAVTITLDQELIQEGLAREVVRRIQNMRKSAGFRIEDYIITCYRADPDLAAVIERHSDYIRRETLSRELTTQEMALRGYREDFQIEGHNLSLEIAKAG